jgi:predicted ATPase
MAITKIKVSNFKSFDELEIDLRSLNVVVGGNASGKSNFLEIFRFLRAIGDYGLENAVSLQGGMEYLANLQIGATRPVSLEITAEMPELRRAFQKTIQKEGAFTYTFVLRASQVGSGYEVVEDRFTGAGEPFPTRAALQHFFPISLLDMDPRLPKRGAPMTGKADLEPDGSNLAIVLKNLLQNEQKRERFIRLFKDVLPFVEDLKVESFLDRSLLLSLKESFGPHTFIPASFLSDGTLQMAALIIALYFERSKVTVLEEPDRNIHPHLISRLASMMRDASGSRQVIVTTHNPELVKHTALEDLLLMRRDEHGFSRISRPAESEELKVFLANDLGVEDLYVQNLLDIGHAV